MVAPKLGLACSFVQAEVGPRNAGAVGDNGIGCIWNRSEIRSNASVRRHGAVARNQGAAVIPGRCRPSTAHDPIRLFNAALVRQRVSEWSGRPARLLGYGKSAIPGIGAGGQRSRNAAESRRPRGRVIFASATPAVGHHAETRTRPEREIGKGESIIAERSSGLRDAWATSCRPASTPSSCRIRDRPGRGCCGNTARSAIIFPAPGCTPPPNGRPW